MRNDDMVTLQITNRSAVDGGRPPLVVEMTINRNATCDVLDWYGAYAAGDDYDVRINGRMARLGINGELLVGAKKARNNKAA